MWRIFDGHMSYFQEYGMLPDTLAVKVKSLIQEVKKKHRTLALARATLTKVEVAIFKTIS